jgi:hypothetical protein
MTSPKRRGRPSFASAGMSTVPFKIPKRRLAASQPVPEMAIVVTAVVAEGAPLHPRVNTANDNDEDGGFVRASRFCVSLR